MTKTKEIHITYIGRLEKEKGIEMIIDSIKRGREEERNIVWHICGDGSFYDRLLKLEKYEKLDIRIYGYLEKEKINGILNTTDLVLMPSLFLETFGLVALETLSKGIPICGFARGGLIEFIHPALILDTDKPIDSFFRILDNGIFPVLDVSDFSYEIWMERLKNLTEGTHRILLVTDYIERIGGAEQYVYELAHSLRSLGKIVDIYGYTGNLSKLMRIWLMLLSPFAFWRGWSITKKIHEYQPDLIWMHTILRYIGPYGVRSISNFSGQKYITHHDLGLITPWPSEIYSEKNIPKSPKLTDWIYPSRVYIGRSISIFMKWCIISLIWFFLKKDVTPQLLRPLVSTLPGINTQVLNTQNITHILPSLWMQPFFQKYSQTHPMIFPHTSRNTISVKQ